ncbi:MAG: putative assembly protein [Betaproteobacteria bacterium ADurb.Bin341]|nr:MAG: putative assembly protein [Betaproteobacteria bacterium ADurb.Bin341]
MKALKIIAAVVVVLALLLAGAAALIAYKFDPAWAKQEVTRVVKEQKQRTLNIEGNIGLSFFPSLGVRLGKASLSEFQSDKEFARIDGARISVRLMPLLSKKLVVDQIDLAGVHANIVRHKEGRFNFDDLLGKEKTEDSAAVQFDIAGIHLTGGIDYRDEASGQTFRLSGLTLDTGHLARTAQGKAKLAGQFSDKSTALQIDLGTDYDIDVDAQRFALANLKGKVGGEAAGLKQAAVTLGARTFALALQKNELSIDELKGEIKAMLGNEMLEGALEAPKLAIAGEQASGAAVTGAFRLSGKAREINGKLNISALQGTPDTIKIDQIAAQWSYRQGTTTVRGQLASPAQGNFKNRLFSLAKLAGAVEIESPSMPMKQLKLPLTGNLLADLSKSVFSGALSTRFDETSAQSTWKILRLAPLSATFDASIDRLNIDKYFPPAADGTASTGKGSASPAKDAPVDLSALKGIDLKGTLRIGFLQFSNAKITNLRANLQLSNGHLDVNPFNAEAYQGAISGSLMANANGNRIAARQSINNVNIGPLLKDVANKDILEGRGNLQIDVNTAGASVNALKQALGGTAAVQLRDGAIKGINLAASLREYKAKLSGKQAAVQKAKQSEKTDFSELTASFKINRGIASNDDLSAKSPFMRLSGAGIIDLVRNLLDYKTKVTIVGTSKGQEGKDLEQLKGLTIPVHLSGPFEDLSYKLDFASMAGALIESKAKEEVKKGLEKKAGDKLKGLFKKK